LKDVRENKQITYKGKPIKITADFSMETLKTRKAWSEVFWELNGNNFNPRILLFALVIFQLWSHACYSGQPQTFISLHWPPSDGITFVHHQTQFIL
jgi:hypothetical protein